MGDCTGTRGDSQEKRTTATAWSENSGRLQRLTGSNSTSGTPSAGPRATTGEDEQKNGVEPPSLRNSNRDRLCPGPTCIRGNEKADSQPNLPREESGTSFIELPYTSASNRAGRISERWSAAKAKWEADKCNKHFSYRLKGMTWTKRPVPITSVKSLVSCFYQRKSGHAPTRVCIKRFGHLEDDRWWWCAGPTAQSWEYLFRNCSRW